MALEAGPALASERAKSIQYYVGYEILCVSPPLAEAADCGHRVRIVSASFAAAAARALRSYTHIVVVCGSFA